MARTFSQGYYHPRHPEKYKGKIDRIVFRSSWELDFCKFCDNNQRVLEWASEPISIPYCSPIDKKMHKYFPDFYVLYLNNEDKIVREIIEIKPLSQLSPPKFSGGKSKRTILTESITWAINQAKWESAEAFCKKHGMTFRKLTQNNIYK